jgi:hypothetical protein
VRGKNGEGKPALSEAEGMPSRQPARRRRYGVDLGVELFNTELFNTELFNT